MCAFVCVCVRVCAFVCVCVLAYVRARECVCVFISIIGICLFVMYKTCNWCPIGFILMKTKFISILLRLIKNFLTEHIITSIT